MPRSHGVSRMAMPSTILPVVEARGVPADRFPSALIRSGCRTACQPPRPRLLSADDERSCGRLRWLPRHSAFRAGACQAATATSRVAGQIGRASCRESVCQYVLISLVPVSFKKKIHFFFLLLFSFLFL